jgi:hypothetical protein
MKQRRGGIKMMKAIQYITMNFMNVLEKLTLFRAQPTKNEESGKGREAKVPLFSIHLTQFT